MKSFTAPFGKGRYEVGKQHGSYICNIYDEHGNHQEAYVRDTLQELEECIIDYYM